MSPLFVGLLIAGGIVAPPPAGSAQGTLTVNGATATLTRAYAREASPMPGDSLPLVRVVLSDAPLGAEALDADNPLPLDRLADARKVRALSAMLDRDAHIVNVSFFDAHFDMAPSGVASAYRFDGTVGADEIAGRLYTTAPRTFAKDQFEFSVTFRAAVERAHTLTPAQQSAAANSEQAKLVLAYCKAARAGDVAALKKIMTPDFAKDIDGPEGKQALELLKATTPESPTVTDVIVTGDTAKVTLTATEGATTTSEKISLLKVNGVWKVNWKG